MLRHKERFSPSSSSLFVSTFSSSSISSFIWSQYSCSFSCCFSRSLKTLPRMVYVVSLDTLRTDAETEAPLSNVCKFSPWPLRRAFKSIADFFRMPPAFVLLAFSASAAFRVCFLVVGRLDCEAYLLVVTSRLTRMLPLTTHISRFSRGSGFLAR